MTEKCKRNPGCEAPANSGHWCPASFVQVRNLGLAPQMSPFVRRALARELPAKELAR